MFHLFILETLNLTRTIGVTIYCYEINFIVTSKSRALEKLLIVMDQLWQFQRVFMDLTENEEILSNGLDHSLPDLSMATADAPGPPFRGGLVLGSTS